MYLFAEGAYPTDAFSVDLHRAEQVPYDVQINKTVWMGKPVLCFNIMWK